MRTEQPKMIYLKDYQAPEYLIDETHLTFELFEDHSLVHAQLVMRRNPARGPGLPPLVLDGQQLELLSVTLADQELSAADYQLTENHLTLQPKSETFTVDTSVKIHPETNTALEGLKACTSPARCSAPSARPKVSARSLTTSTART